MVFNIILQTRCNFHTIHLTYLNYFGTAPTGTVFRIESPATGSDDELETTGPEPL